MNLPTRIRAAGLLGLTLLTAHSAGAQAAGVEADAFWVRAAPPGVAMMAGYVVLSNCGQRPVQLVGAVSDSFAAVEVHRTEIVDGVNRMRPLSVLEIASGATVRLEPGGAHLMLIRPSRALAEGDTVPITLRFDGGATLAVDFPVLRQAPAR